VERRSEASGNAGDQTSPDVYGFCEETLQVFLEKYSLIE
jgi:hypothetical protein